VATDSGTMPQGTQVLLRVTAQGNETVEGTREIALTQKTDVRYEAAGSELSVTGNWQLELVIRRPNTEDWSRTAAMDVRAVPPEALVPGAPPLFRGWNAGLALIFAALGIVAVAVATRREEQLRDVATYAGFGLGLLVTAGLILVVTYLPPERTESVGLIEDNAQTVSEGGQLFQQYCASCHGVGGQGNGPQAPFLARPPADLTAAHVDTHTDTDLHWWILNGIQPAMPGFQQDVSDQQAWELVYFVRSLRQPVQGRP